MENVKENVKKKILDIFFKCWKILDVQKILQNVQLSFKNLGCVKNVGNCWTFLKNKFWKMKFFEKILDVWTYCHLKKNTIGRKVLKNVRYSHLISARVTVWCLQMIKDVINNLTSVGERYMKIKWVLSPFKASKVETVFSFTQNYISHNPTPHSAHA